MKIKMKMKEADGLQTAGYRDDPSSICQNLFFS
jgi:hypothetical protein